jgi:hypothetical protein
MIQINAAQWHAGRTPQAVCTLDQQIRDHGMAMGHTLQVFSGIQLSVRPS